MKNKKNIIGIVIAALLAAAALAANFFAVAELAEEQGVMLSSMVLILALLFSLFYLLVGCRKLRGAEHFKEFCVCYGLCCLRAIAGVGVSVGPLALVFTAVVFACVVVLATVKDLGVARSMRYTIALFAAQLGAFLSELCSGMDMSGAVIHGSELLLGILTVLMVFAKYKDKAQRGTK